jgi:hypothetical protein
VLAAFPIVPSLAGGAEWAGKLAPAAVDPPPTILSPRSTDSLLPLSVSIELPGASVEPDRPFTVTAVPSGGFGGSLRYSWNDSLGVAGANASIVLMAPSYGTVVVSVTAVDFLGDTAEASATVGIGTTPSIALDPLLSETDVGLPIPVRIEVNGTFAPYSVDWQLLPGGASGSSTIDAPGTVEIAAVVEAPGYAWVEATVTDSRGVATTIDGIVGTVHPRPQLLLTLPQSAVDCGSVARVLGLVVGGTPPFSWSAAASLPVLNVSGASGAVGPTEAINWSGEFDESGNATVRFDIADAAGILLLANTTLQVFGALTPALAIATPDPGVGSPLNLSVDLSGGVSPYRYELTLSDGEESGGTAPSAGPIFWVAHPASPGYLVIQVTVEDAVLGAARLETTVIVGPDPGPTPATPPAPGPTAGSDPPHTGSPDVGTEGAAIAGVLVLGLVAVGAGWWGWRRIRARRKRPTTGEPPGVEVVARLLRGSAGTEAAALRVLAEEEGLAPSEIDGAMRRLQSSGQVIVERGPEGMELWRWRTGSAGAPPGEGPP